MSNKDFVNTLFENTTLAYSENSSSIARASWRAERPRFPIFTRIISFCALKYKVGALPWQNCRVKRAWHRLWGITIGGRVRYAYSAVQGPPCARKLAPFVHPRPIQARHGFSTRSSTRRSFLSFFFPLRFTHIRTLNYRHWIFDEAHPRKFDIEFRSCAQFALSSTVRRAVAKEILELRNFIAILKFSIYNVS